MEQDEIKSSKKIDGFYLRCMVIVNYLISPKANGEFFKDMLSSFPIGSPNPFPTVPNTAVDLSLHPFLTSPDVDQNYQPVVTSEYLTFPFVSR
jgi:hypothetical protein